MERDAYMERDEWMSKYAGASALSSADLKQGGDEEARPQRRHCQWARRHLTPSRAEQGRAPTKLLAAATLGAAGAAGRKLGSWLKREPSY